MLSQRAVQLSMRRLTAINPSTFHKTSALSRFAAPAAIATGRHHQYRFAATQPTSPEDAYSILAAQRRNRPVAPHLSIYQPQITWYLSSLTRVTGVALSGTFYLYGIAYLIAPLIGWHLESASLAAAFATWPVFAKLMTKFVVALPLTFHTFNGVRHLMWDTGAQLKNQQVINTGWLVVGATLLGAVGLAVM